MDMSTHMKIPAVPANTNMTDSAGESNFINPPRKMNSSAKTKRRCPYCPFSSYYSASLTVHLRRHTGEKPYQCIFCNKVFGDRSNMNSHVRRYHREGKGRKLSDMSAALSSRHSFSAMRNRPISIKSPQTPSRTTSIDQLPIISSVYTKDNPLGHTGVLIKSPINFTSALRSISSDSPPTMVSAAISGETSGLSQKLNRRKPAVVRKQVRPNYLATDNNIFASLREENMFGPSGSESPNEEENLHALHSTDKPDNEVFGSVLSPKEEERDASREIPSLLSPIINVGEPVSQNISLVQEDSSQSALNELYECKHCDIYFKSCILHTLHMGCHGYDDPFKCNVCGVKCKDSVEFHCHFARGNHNGAL